MNIIFNTEMFNNPKAKVISIKVKEGDKVKKGDPLIKLESGKANQILTAPTSGFISRLFVTIDEEVSDGKVLLEIEEEVENSFGEIKEKEILEKAIETDIAIIGGGPGGYVAALYGKKFNLDIVVIEEHSLGGTCLNVGCIPTKTLVSASEKFREIQEGKQYGIKIENVSFDLSTTISKKDSVVKTLVGGIQYLFQANGITLLKGKGSFLNTNTIQVIGEGKNIVKAKDVIIATGSKPVRLKCPGMDLPFVLDSTRMLSNTILPKSLTIIGGGIIGMEFAFIYSSFGVEVNVVEFMDHILFNLDEDIISEMEKMAKKMGISIYSSSKVKEVKQTEDNEAIVVFENNNTDKFLVSELVLSSVGRIPNMYGLNLEVTGIELNEKERGIKVNEKLETNIPHLYAIGDVTNIIQLAHAAMHQGMVAVDNILGKNVSIKPNYLIPNVIFTNPEIAIVGKTEKQLQQEGKNYKVSKFPYLANGKALSMSHTEGFVKLIMEEATKKVIGAQILGADAGNLISSMCIAIQNGLTEEEIARTIYPHPTLGEMLQEAALGLTIGPLHSHE